MLVSLKVSTLFRILKFKYTIVSRKYNNMILFVIMVALFKVISKSILNTSVYEN